MQDKLKTMHWRERDEWVWQQKCERCPWMSIINGKRYCRITAKQATRDTCAFVHWGCS